MLGLVGLLGAIMASLSMDAPSDEEDSRHGDDAAPETEGWGVSTAFMEDAPSVVDPPVTPADAVTARVNRMACRNPMTVKFCLTLI
jgi:hypothetical protein